MGMSRGRMRRLQLLLNWEIEECVTLGETMSERSFGQTLRECSHHFKCPVDALWRDAMID